MKLCCEQGAGQKKIWECTQELLPTWNEVRNDPTCQVKECTSVDQDGLSTFSKVEVTVSETPMNKTISCADSKTGGDDDTHHHRHRPVLVLRKLVCAAHERLFSLLGRTVRHRVRTHRD